MRCYLNMFEANSFENLTGHKVSGHCFQNVLALVMVHLSPKEKEGEACMSNICKY